MQQSLLQLARFDFLVSEVFKCFADVELESILTQYETFRLHLTSQTISDRSVVLAAAHFITFHEQLQRNMSATAARQVIEGKPIAPITSDVALSKYGATHWSMTIYGIEYQQLAVGGNEFSSMAFGI